MNQNEKKLRQAIAANALFSIISASLLLILTETIADFMQVVYTDVLLVVGVGLILFVLFLIYNWRSKPLKISYIWAIIIQDWLWVIASIVLLITRPFGLSWQGHLLIAEVAVVVAALAIVQQIALQALSKT